ncbi:MAG: L-threonylcarbamoyladenylate synthase [Parabacteroides sp.]|nr:threonylcarbamoyl-AMP synthase [Parabacteroides sp.]MDD6100612.1 L-threonylcarbamoyladenylate synthase [bacterium]MDD6749077.1 L-threonylcarbamoyladenylate synthase [bacterium]MDD6837205.1 L-threonylcarbamoyladenylate synthase [bacterium]MDD7631793.1 L-threonylcarbamoyladenylate synthase [bacterium]
MNEDLKKACDVLRKGGLILYPTDTIWGIGCDATNEEAVQRVYTLKQRADNKAMLLLLGNEARLESYVQEVPEIAWSLIEVADRPLTLIYPGARNLAPNLIAEDGSVGIRITREEFSRRLCEQFRRPVVSTSANISGQPAPHTFQEIAEEIKQGVDYIVQYRQDDLTAAQPSSIIKLGAGGLFQIIR